ncbi:MAG: hypothetical protein ACR2NU_11520 [Aeoliella sp.]
MTTDAAPITEVDGTASLRRTIYVILLAIAIGQMAGRILAVNSVNYKTLSARRVSERLDTFREQQIASGADEQTVTERVQRKRRELVQKISLERPFLSANDRSRWLTVRSLVEDGTYEVDNFFREPRWDSIDMVSHLGRDGEQHYYSSKPPLLATLVAGKYWVVHKLTGWTLGTHPYEVGRLLLLIINIPAMLILFIVIAKLAEQLGTTDWGRLFVVASATLGTLLTTFSITLNNHTIAAASAAVAIYFYVQIARSIEPRSWHYAACGLATAFTAANELPAVAFLVLLGLLLLVRDWRKTLLFGLPSVLLVAAAFFGTNYLAHDSLKPPYMHRSEDPADNWYLFSYEKNGRTVQSYWHNRQGIDAGELSKQTYAWHVLVGHHGVYSLTPIWLFTLGGICIWTFRGNRIQRELALAALALTITCFVFFIALRPQMDRNYGGMTSGFRWMFWFAPLWLVTMLPMVDTIYRSRVARAVALLLLAMSVLSVSYPTWNPWEQPWLYNALEHYGWL